MNIFLFFLISLAIFLMNLILIYISSIIFLELFLGNNFIDINILFCIFDIFLVLFPINLFLSFIEIKFIEKYKIYRIFFQIL